MRVIYHNWSATKQRPHPQSVAEMSHHSVLSGDRIRQCETSSGSRHTYYLLQDTNDDEDLRRRVAPISCPSNPRRGTNSLCTDVGDSQTPFTDAVCVRDDMKPVYIHISPEHGKRLHTYHSLLSRQQKMLVKSTIRTAE